MMLLKPVAALFLLVVLAFLVAPIFVAASVSFTGDDFLIFPPVGFSMRWYREIASNPLWLGSALNTLVIGLGCATVATAVGTMAAYGISRLRRRLVREACLIFFILPLAAPHMALAMAMYPVFAWAGLIGTRFGVALAQSLFALPFVVLAVTSTIRRRDRDLEQAARTLGASPVQSFLYVVAPLLAPGIAAGAILAFMTSFDDVTVPIFLSGTSAGTLPKTMLDALYLSGDPSVMAASTAVSLVGLLLFVTASALLGRAGG